MLIRCWGARGAIPVSGQEYLKYGGDTTCIEIRTKGDEIIIVDAGSGIRRLGNRLHSENRHEYHMIFTHAHWDHLIGFPFFKPLHSRKTLIKMTGCPFAQVSIKEMISRVMRPPNFPVKYSDLRAQIDYGDTCDTSFTIGSVTVDPIPLSHPNFGNGYKFTEDGKTFVFITDNELTFKHPGGLDYEDYLRFSANSDLLVHDAEYSDKDYKIKKEWGHTAYKDALKLAMEANAKKFVLFHHNKERTDKDLDLIVSDCQNIIEENGSSMACIAATQEMEIEL
jgi:phosphoribosyl 1,2-cyclic phosphodiesterase